MKCEEIKTKFLEAFSETAGGLPVVPAPGMVDPGVAEHVKTCARCAEELAGLRATFALLDEWKQPEPSPDFAARLNLRLEEDRAAGKLDGGFWQRLFYGSPAWQPVAAAFLFAALVLGAVEYAAAPAGNDGDAPENPVMAVANRPLPGTAVADLQALDREEMFADFELLDDLMTENGNGETESPSLDVSTGKNKKGGA